MTSFLQTKQAQQPTHLCPYCNGAANVRVQAPDLNRQSSDVVYSLAACSICRLMFVTNPPKDLAKYYKSDYYSVPKRAADLDPHLSAQRFKIDIVKRFASGGTLLEIGPAIGMFCLLAKNYGYEVSAIEMDKDCVDFLAREVGVRAVQSTDPAATMEVEARSYDVICLWHVIEHLERPWQTLDVMVRHLKPGGVIVVAAPNPDAPQAALLRRNWPHYDLPRHLYQLPISWMESYAQKMELTVALATTCDEGSRYWSKFTWAMILQRLMPWRRLKGRSWMMGLGLGRLFALWEDKEGRGAAYTMVLQRRM